MSSNKQYNKKKFVDRREAKSQDIRRALTHRARLRKNYFKLLEKEGLQEHSKPRRDDNDDDEEEGEGEGEGKHEGKPRHKKQAFSFEERAKIVKQRKEEKRKQKLESVQEKLARIETKSKERAFRKEQFKKSTTKGQPLMGPRINNLLDKIKKDMSN